MSKDKKEDKKTEDSNVDSAFKIWFEGIEKAAAIKFRGGPEDEVRQVWIDIIDLMMEDEFESPEEYNRWKNLGENEKYKGIEKYPINYECFLESVDSALDMLKVSDDSSQLTDKDNARNIIARAFSRAANREVKTGIDLAPGTELMPSEMIAKLGITKEKLIESFCMDPQVKSVGCVNGEFIVNTAGGKIRFRLVFGDEAGGGKA